MPIAPRPNTCAVLTRDSWGRFGDNCAQPPTHRGLWQYADHSAHILLCASHALELDGHSQLTLLEASRPAKRVQEPRRGLGPEAREHR